MTDEDLLDLLRGRLAGRTGDLLTPPDIHGMLDGDLIAAGGRGEAIAPLRDRALQLAVEQNILEAATKPPAPLEGCYRVLE